MVVFPNAKINIGLQVLDKREDGYHNIESIFYPVGLCDVLEIVRSNEFSFTQSGLPVFGEMTDNLVVKAYQLLQKEYNIGSVSIHLHKVIPTGAGLGGGSSDATFALKLLNELFELKMDDSKLKSFSLKLGSDCPFFVNNEPSLVSGRGEIFNKTNLKLTNKWIKIVHIGLHISTKEAFSGISTNMKSTAELSIDYTVNELDLKRCKNDFEQYIFRSHPILSHFKNGLLKQGAIYAAMTGSGSAIFGIFESEPTKTNTDYFEYIGKLS